MEGFLRPVNDTPVPGPIFLKLFSVAMKYHSGQRRAIPPMEERCVEDVPPGAYMLTDHPDNQMGIAVVRECRNLMPLEQANRLAASFLFRLGGIVKLINSGSLQEFTIQEDDGVQVRDEVLLVAAEYPLEPEGEFEPHGYLERVRRRIVIEGGTSPSA